MKPVIKTFVVPTGEDFARPCGTCNKVIQPGEHAHYFHLEDMHEFCSEACFRTYYAADDEVQALLKAQPVII